MANPLVSLVVPVYNAEIYIQMTLDSIHEQSMSEFECILVNDFSDDNSVNIIKEYLKKDRRFKLISHRANGGLSAARNSGLRFAKGRYVSFLDADDLIMPKSLELRMRALSAYDNDDKVIGVYAGSVTISENCKKAPQGVDIKLKVIDFITSGGQCPFNANQPMFKTDLFRLVGGFDESLSQAEDYDMWMRILRRGYRVMPVNTQLVTYRQTPGSMIRKNPLLHLDTSYERYFENFKKLPLNRFDDRFEVNLMNSLSEYGQELNIANRVLEFSGLALAKGDSLNSIKERLVKYLPNYFDIIEYHRDFIKGIHKGINRYYGKNIDIYASQYKDLFEKITKLYSDFCTDSKKINLDTNGKEVSQILNQSFGDIAIVPSVAIQKNIDLLFFPHKDYHVQVIYLLKSYLDSLGISFLVVDFSSHYRDEGVKKSTKLYKLPKIGYSNFILGNFNPKLLVVFNDWDPILRSILLAAKKSGIATMGIVEGIQDYLDADTKQDRKAYQVVDHLFLPGEFDRKYFSGSNQNILIGGIPRIFKMYHETKNVHKKKFISQKPTILINSNFSYGVLEDKRDEWLSLAVGACQANGFNVVISRHPADRGELFADLVTDKSFYDVLMSCDACISRFASSMLESMAVGVMPIYFNPHDEQVDKFKSPKGAYPIANTLNDLNYVLENLEVFYEKYCVNFNGFLSEHSGSLEEDPAKIIAEGIIDIIRSFDMNLIDMKLFASEMQYIDYISGSFNNISILRKYSSEKLLYMLNIKNYNSLDGISDLIRKKEYQIALDVIENIEKQGFLPISLQSIKKSLVFLVKNIKCKY
ncbi:MAG: glycosyltransferase [Moraxella sp.]|nr:glycosyltransferase [Moraxella sp.]